MSAAGRAPQFAQPLVAAAMVAVELVSKRTFLVVVLVVILCPIELRSGRDFSHDRILERFGLVECGFRLLRFDFLFVIVKENRGAVLMPDVAELAITRGRIDIVPEDVEQLAIAGFLRIESYLDRFGVTGAASGDLFIGRIDLLPAGVADRCRDYAGHSLE